MADVAAQIPLAVNVPPPLNPGPAIAQVEGIQNAKALAEQRGAIADLRQQQTADLAQKAADQASINSAVQSANGDWGAAAEALGKAGMQRAQNTLLSMKQARDTAELKQATDVASLHTKSIDLISQVLNSVDPNDPNSYRAAYPLLKGAVSQDPKIQAIVGTILPDPSSPTFDPASIGPAVTKAQNMAVPYKDYWDKMQAGLKEADSGSAVKGLGIILDANKAADPQTLLGFVQAAQRRGMKPETAAPFINAIQTGQAKSDPLVFSKLGGSVSPEQAATMTGTIPGTNIATETAQKDAALEAVERTKANAAAATAQVAVSDAAVTQAAQRYLDTGVLPALGMGGAGGLRQQIMNRAAQLAPNARLAANSAEYRANAGTLAPLTKQLNSLEAFENTANANLKQFTDLADKIPDTGVPWLNTPVRALSQNVVGSTVMPAVNAARQVALTEISRIVSNPNLTGQLSDSARSEVMGLSPDNATIPQIKRVIGVLQTDMANRRQAMQQQIEDIQSRLGITGQQPPSGGGLTVVDPNGKPHTFATAAQAQAFRDKIKAAGGGSE